MPLVKKKKKHKKGLQVIMVLFQSNCMPSQSPKHLAGELAVWMGRGSSCPDHNSGPHSLNPFALGICLLQPSFEIYFMKAELSFFIVGSWLHCKARMYGMSAKQKGLMDQQKLKKKKIIKVKMYFKYQANLRLTFKPHLISLWERWLTKVGNTGLKLSCHLFLQH